jgi:glutamine amidotransferase
MIKIVDYGSGNINAIANIYKRLNIAVSFAQTPNDLESATKIILPGVGAFDYAMNCLDMSGMRRVLDDAVMLRKTPVLGICLGMQILAQRSEEGKREGLGWIPGEVKRFDPLNIPPPAQIPHMGWNDVVPARPSGLFAGMGEQSVFYFLHSYYFSCVNPENVLATSRYGNEFCCAVNSERIFGVQFHPEKSHQWGIQLLKNFAAL